MIKRILRSFSLFVSALLVLLGNLVVPAYAREADSCFLSDEEQQIIEQYHSGNTDAGLEKRRELVEQHDLQDYVDDRFFLNDAFYETYPIGTLMQDGLVLLDRTQTPAWRQQLEALLHSDQTYILPRAMSVTSLNQVTAVWGPGTITNGLWKLSNNQFAFCANGRLAPPAAGTPTSDPYVVDNAALRKALFYGLHGPENIMAGKGYTNEQMIVATNDFVSMAYAGHSVGSLAANGWHWNNWIKGLYDQVQAKPDPRSKGYEAYMVNTSGTGTSWVGDTTALQPLAYGMYAPKGQAQIRKVSSNTEISSANPNYSLAGAQYGLFADPAAAKQIGTFTIGADLTSNVIGDLEPKTYYVKETKAPQGFALDSAIYPLQVNANVTTVLTCADAPQHNPVDLLIQKADKDTKAPLADAHFTVKYFADPAKAPTRTWVLKSDPDGHVRLDDAHKVSGDAFYKNAKGQPVLPIGTITIQETKAPAGYFLDPAVHTQTIRPGSDQETLSVFKTVSVPNTNISLTLNKKQTGTDIPVANVTFTHTSPSNVRKDVTTDAKGVIRWTHLEQGVHTLSEKPAPGYRPIEKPIRFEVTGQGIRLFEAHPNASLENNVLTVFNKENPVPVRILKKNEKGTALKGAQFTVYADQALTDVIETVETDEQGVAEFKALEPKTNYWIKETKAPHGYRLPKDEAVELYFESVPAQGILNVTLDGKADHEAVQIAEENGTKTIVLGFVNVTGIQLPQTGSAGYLKALIAGCAMVLLAWFKGNGKGKK